MTTNAAVPPDLTLADPDGRPVRLGDLVSTNRLTVIQLVRYFGCLPCQEWCVDLDVQVARLSEPAIGAAAIGGSADYQARWLRDEKGVSMPLLLDAGHRFRDAVGAAAPLGVRILNPRGVAAYVGSFRRGYRPQSITRDTVRSPGVVIVDSSGTVRWQHVGKRIGDSPPVARVLDAAAKLH